MGYRELELSVPLEFPDEQIRRCIARSLRSIADEFSYVILRKDLDARRKLNVHWAIRVAVASKRIPGPTPEAEPELAIPYAAGLHLLNVPRRDDRPGGTDGGAQRGERDEPPRPRRFPH